MGSSVLSKLPEAVAVCWGGDGALGCHWWPAQKVQTHCRWADFRTLQSFAKEKAKKRNFLEMGQRLRLREEVRAETQAVTINLPKLGHSAGFSVSFSLAWANKETSNDSPSRGGTCAVKSLVFRDKCQIGNPQSLMGGITSL